MKIAAKISRLLLFLKVPESLVEVPDRLSVSAFYSLEIMVSKRAVILLVASPAAFTISSPSVT